MRQFILMWMFHIYYSIGFLWICLRKTVIVRLKVRFHMKLSHEWISANHTSTWMYFYFSNLADGFLQASLVFCSDPYDQWPTFVKWWVKLGCSYGKSSQLTYMVGRTMALGPFAHHLVHWDEPWHASISQVFQLARDHQWICWKPSSELIPGPI